MTVRRLLITFFVFALVVAACGTGASQQGANDNGIGSSEAPFIEGTAVLDDPMVTTSPEFDTTAPATGESDISGTAYPMPTTDALVTPLPDSDNDNDNANGNDNGNENDAPVATQGAADLPGTGFPTQSERAEILQPELREDIMRLSSLIGLQVQDANGQMVGVVSDYIINTCETYIVYLVVDGSGNANLGQGGMQSTQAPGQGGQGGLQSTQAPGQSGVLPTQSAAYGSQGMGGRFLIPFEAFSVNSGMWDVQNRALVLSLPADVVSQAPGFTATALFPLDWEDEARGFWDQHIHISNLSSECRTESGTVNKIGFATQLLQAELRDENGVVYGRVVDAIVEPETGSIDFFVVELSEGGMVLIPLAALNIPEEALQGNGQAVWLVLLTDPSMLQQAPTLDNVDGAVDIQNHNDARDYWGQQQPQP